MDITGKLESFMGGNLMFCYLINLIEVFGFAINGYCIILKRNSMMMKRKSVMNLFMTWKFKWRQNYNHKSFIFFLPPSRHDSLSPHNHYCHLMIPFSFFVTNLLNEIACKFKCHQRGRETSTHKEMINSSSIKFTSCL